MEDIKCVACMRQTKDGGQFVATHTESFLLSRDIFYVSTFLEKKRVGVAQELTKLQN